MMELSAKIAVQKFCDVWKDCFAQVVASFGAPSLATNWTVALTDVSSPDAQAATTEESTFVDSWFAVRGSLQGAVVWRCAKNVAVQFAQLLQSESPDAASEFSEVQRDAFAEFLRQVAGQVVAAWSQATGNEIELVYAAAPDSQLSASQTASLQLTSEKFSDLTLQIFVDAALCGALNAAPPADSTSHTVPGTAANVSANSSEPVVSPPFDGPIPNLALLLDVELEATIRFGQRDMLLREVFGLMPGAVVELNQLVNEPAELLVAGRLIARGEVVVVDGNFGLRVTEVASAGQRAALLEL